MDEIASKIKYLRIENNISQEELAYNIRVSRQAISKWENGAVLPSVDNLIALCKFFNVDLNYFIDMESAVHDEKSVENFSKIKEISRTAIADWLFPVILTFLGLVDLTLLITFSVFCKIYCENFGRTSPISLDLLLIAVFLFLAFVGLTVFTAFKYKNYMRTKANY